MSRARHGLHGRLCERHHLRRAQQPYYVEPQARVPPDAVDLKRHCRKEASEPDRPTMCGPTKCIRPRAVIE